MGCSSSKPIIIPLDQTFEVFRGQQAQERVKLEVKRWGASEHASNVVREGARGGSSIMEGFKPQYSIVKPIIEMSKEQYRKQYLNQVDNKRQVVARLCDFGRCWSFNLRNHGYECKAPDSSRTLFTVYASDNGLLMINLQVSNNPNASGIQTGTCLILDPRSGLLTWRNGGRGPEYRCAKINNGTITVERGVDKALVSVLAAILADSKEVKWLFSAAKVAAKFGAGAPAKGFQGVVATEAMRFVQQDSNMPINRTEMVYYAADRIAPRSQVVGQIAGDSYNDHNRNCSSNTCDGRGKRQMYHDRSQSYHDATHRGYCR